MTNDLIALLIYGSSARNDNGPHSDIDLLGVCDDRSVTRKSIVGSVNLCMYTAGKLIGWAEDGNLFCYHLVNEAKALHDPEMFLDKLQGRFKLRNDYSKEMSLGFHVFHWSADKRRSSNRWLYFNAAMTWSLRTVCAAHGAESHVPVFSGRAIAHICNNKRLEHLIARRGDEPFSDGDVKVMLSAIDGMLANRTILAVASLPVESQKYYAKVCSVDAPLRSSMNYA